MNHGMSHFEDNICEGCLTVMPGGELSERYYRDSGRRICEMCLLSVIRESEIIVENGETEVKVSVTFNSIVFEDVCGENLLLPLAFLSHGVSIIGQGWDWVTIDPGDAMVMKIGNQNNGVEQIHTYVLDRIWELYV